MAGWLHGVCVCECFFVFPLCGFSLTLFCNYPQDMLQEVRSTVNQETPFRTAGDKYSCCVTRTKLQTPGNAEEHKRQETPTSIPAVCWDFQIRHSIHSLYIGLNSGSNKPFRSQ